MYHQESTSMKKHIFVNWLLFSIVFYASYSICDENIVFERMTLCTPNPIGPYSVNQYKPQEGFGGDTLIQTPFGYTPIKRLSEGDVAISSAGEEKKIIAITKNYVNQYVKLTLNDVTMFVGYDQRYYAFPTCASIKAHRFRPGDMVLNLNRDGCFVVDVEIINENKLLYCLTVEDHLFCIAPSDVCVHNAEPLVLGLSSVCLGSVITTNPVAATIGATVALSAIAHKAYQSYIQEYPHNDVIVSLPVDVILAERFYYLERLSSLQAIYQELLFVKNGLENLKALFTPNSASFTYQFLKQAIPVHTRQQNQMLQISGTREKQLSDQQKENLRILREAELRHMEQKIITLQTVLAFHLNELIEQLHAVDKEYENAKDEINSGVFLWNNNYGKITPAIALQSYKTSLLDDCLLKSFNQKLNELKVVSQYYRDCIESDCLQQSTNIFDLLEKMNAVIAEFDQKVAKEKSRAVGNIAIAERYFWRYRISIENAKRDITTQLQKNRDGRNAKAVTEAKNKLESIVVVGSPQNNNNDDPERDLRNKSNPFKTTKEATEAAEKLGFKKTNYHSQRQPVFKKGNRYITPDRTSHNGGVWKMADSVDNLVDKTTRMGTYDQFLNRIGD